MQSTLNIHPFTDAQLYIDCFEKIGNNSIDSNQYIECKYNKTSPLNFRLGNGNSVSFGSESYISVSCQVFATRSPETCSCNFFVNPSSPDYLQECNSCTIRNISNTEFLPHVDCSNLFKGDCVGIDAAGLCIDNNGGVADPAPVRSPTSNTSSAVLVPTKLVGTIFSIGFVMMMNSLIESIW